MMYQMYEEGAQRKSKACPRGARIECTFMVVDDVNSQLKPGFPAHPEVQLIYPYVALCKILTLSNDLT